MREILFRGKRLDNGEWVKGSYVETLRYNNLHWIWGGKECVKIDPETIGQYTGLTDKNGTKIFEGDIIQYTPWYSEETRVEGVIVAERWNCSCCGGVFGFAVNGNGDLRNHADCEVVGNIHDNPELLGGE